MYSPVTAYAIYGAVYYKLYDLSSEDCENICVPSYQHETGIWIICRNLRGGHDILVYVICFAMFFYIHSVDADRDSQLTSRSIDSVAS